MALDEVMRLSEQGLEAEVEFETVVSGNGSDFVVEQNYNSEYYQRTRKNRCGRVTSTNEMIIPSRESVENRFPKLAV